MTGRDDPEWGERVVAVVVVEPASPLPTLDQLREHVKASLPGYAAPTVLEVVETLPRTSSGKVSRITPG